MKSWLDELLESDHASIDGITKLDESKWFNGKVGTKDRVCTIRLLIRVIRSGHSVSEIQDTRKEDKEVVIYNWMRERERKGKRHTTHIHRGHTEWVQTRCIDEVERGRFTKTRWIRLYLHLHLYIHWSIIMWPLTSDLLTK